MPITPFHFGPGLALHALAPRQVSFLAFCTVNVLLDLEPLYYMLTGQYPLHRFFHGYVGASLGVAATLGLFLALRRWVPCRSGGERCAWKGLRPRAVLLGALLGGYSHILLDSLMHADMRPWMPFSEANGLWRAVSLDSLHGGCLLAGVVGLLLLARRGRFRQERTP